MLRGSRSLAPGCLDIIPLAASEEEVAGQSAMLDNLRRDAYASIEWFPLTRGATIGEADLRSNEFVNVFMTQDTRETMHIVTELLMQYLLRMHACRGILDLPVH
ncbi:hypothetical protein BHAP_0321 [Bifidobacterium hapali]|uniref:Uncharacterized protein n=1 Tax=Bifidobacterium hapali TaxID=1630172 RepID=A0A261G4X1_9BIFI|nr:hypothetical protein BHAP_0321 [Bifidobacterium hapali]